MYHWKKVRKPLYFLFLPFAACEDVFISNKFFPSFQSTLLLFDAGSPGEKDQEILGKWHHLF